MVTSLAFIIVRVLRLFLLLFGIFSLATALDQHFIICIIGLYRWFVVNRCFFNDLNFLRGIFGWNVLCYFDDIIAFLLRKRGVFFIVRHITLLIFIRFLFDVLMVAKRDAWIGRHILETSIHSLILRLTVFDLCACLSFTHLFLLLSHVIIVNVHFNLLLWCICLAILFQLRSHESIKFICWSNASRINLRFHIRFIARCSSVIAVLLLFYSTSECISGFFLKRLLFLLVCPDIESFRICFGSWLEFICFSFEFFFTLHSFLTLLVNSEAKVASKDE